MKQTLSILTSALLLSLFSYASASIVELNNGDRISGTILSENEQGVLIQTELFGELTIPAEKISSVLKDEEPAKAEEMVNTPPAPAPEEQAAPVHAPASAIPGMDGLRALTASFMDMINLSDKWASNLSVSISLLSGQTDSRSTNVTFNTERKWENQSLRIELTQEYEVNTKDGVRSTTRDRFKTTARYRHDLSKTMFVQSDSQYMFAHVKGIDHDIRQSLGLGWFLVQSDRLDVTLTPSLTGRSTNLNGEWQDLACAPTLYEEVVYKWTETVNVRQEASALFPINGDSDPSYHFALVFQNKFMENLSLNMEYLYDYDGTVDDLTNASQHSLRLGVGMSF